MNMPDDRFDFPTPNFARPINNWLGVAGQSPPTIEQAMEHQRRWGENRTMAERLDDIARKTGETAWNALPSTIGAKWMQQQMQTDPRQNDPEAVHGAADVALSLLGTGIPFSKPGSLGSAGGKAMAREAAAEVHPGWIDTRLPTGKNEISVGKPGTPRIVDMDALRATPNIHDNNVDLVRNYPNLPNKVIKKSSDKVADAFTDHIKNNLLWLHDRVPAAVRDRSQLWYDGGNKIVKDWSQKYGVNDAGVAGALAALSPQKDWYQNVSLAERVLNTIKHPEYDVRRMTPEMESFFKDTPSLNKPIYQNTLDSIRGKSLGDIDRMDLPKDEQTILKAMWTRLHDEAHVPRHYNIINPEGTIGDVAVNKSGEPSKVSWGSLTEIGKAIQAIESKGERETLNKLMGQKHKVRNFYNNLLDPNAKRGDVTIDTHAVAAGLLRPLGGKSIEVSHNFANYSGKGLPNAGGSANTGIQGTYPLYADAYRKAAAERGILPRQMQSITWEAIRGMFPDTFKSAANNAKVDAIWRQYRNGKATIDDTREKIHDLAGGIRNPSWFK